MEIPPEHRDTARAFVEQARESRKVERASLRLDAISLAVILAALATEGASAVLAGSTLTRAMAVGVVALLAWSAGVRCVRVSDRRAAYRTMVDFADKTETALAFHDLDDDG